jgi:hypothetical protein
VVGKGIDDVLQVEEKTEEVRHGPRGEDGGDAVELTEGGEEAAARARITVRDGGGSAKHADEKSRKGGCLWCDSTGEWGREGGVGLRPFFKWRSGGVEERGGRRSGAMQHMEGGGWGPDPDGRAVSQPTAARPRCARAARRCLNRAA